MFKNTGLISQEFIHKFLTCTHVMIIGLLKTLRVDDEARRDKTKRFLKVIIEVLFSSSLKDFYDTQRVNRQMFKFIQCYIVELRKVINDIEKPEVKQSLTEQLKELTKEHKDDINNTQYNGKDFPHQFKYTKSINELIPRIACFIKFNILYSLEAQKCKMTDIDTDSMVFLNTVANVMKGFICAHLNSVVFSFNAQFLKLKYTRNRCYNNKMFRVIVLNEDNIMHCIPEGLDPTVFKHMKSIIAICGEAMIEQVFQKTIRAVDRKYPIIKSIKKEKSNEEGGEVFPDLSDSSEGKTEHSASVTAKTQQLHMCKIQTLRGLPSDNDDEYVATDATLTNTDTEDDDIIFIKCGIESGTETSAKETHDAETKNIPTPNTEAEDVKQPSDDDLI